MLQITRNVTEVQLVATQPIDDRTVQQESDGLRLDLADPLTVHEKAVVFDGNNVVLQIADRVQLQAMNGDRQDVTS